MSFNKIIVVGNLGREPELRYTPQGTPVCNFTMASNERRKDRSGGEQDVTTWFTVKVWGRRGELAMQYLSKGRQVYVEGRLRTEVWNDRDGRQRLTLEINATDIQFLDSPGESGEGGQSRSSAAAAVTGGVRRFAAIDEERED